MIGKVFAAVERTGAMPAQTVDTALVAIGNKATQAGAGTSLVSWILSSNFGVWVGILIGVAGFLMQLYFNQRRDKREQSEYEMRMSRAKEAP